MKERTVVDQTLKTVDGYNLRFLMKEELSSWCDDAPTGKYRFEIDMRDSAKDHIFDKITLPCGCSFEVGDGFFQVNTHDGYIFYQEFGINK